MTKSPRESESKETPLESGGPAPVVPGIGPAAAAVVAWLLPGAGHFVLGRKSRGVLFFCLVLFSAWLGTALSGHLHTELGGDPLGTLGTIACAGLGLIYGLLRFVLAHQGDIGAVGFEYGTTFLMTAGLMNLLLVLDAWDIARGVKE